MTSYHYNGLTSSVIGGDEWTLAAEISLNYDAADSLTQVYRRDGGEGRWQGTSSIGYDFLGRKTGMSDADLGNWSYAYNALGQLTRQTDARAKTSCLYYDDLGRMRGRVQRTGVNCATPVAVADLDSSYVYDAQGRVQRVSNDNVSRSFIYDSYSRLSGETVTIDSLTRTSSYSYDDHHRPTAVTYPGSEVITTTYGSPGTTVGLSSSVHGALVDSVKYDEARRMTALRFPAGGNLWRTQSYYPWTEPRSGGMLEMKYRVSSEVRSGSCRFASTMTRLWRCDHSWSGSMSSRNSGAEISQQRLVSMRPWSFSTVWWTSWETSPNSFCLSSVNIVLTASCN